MSGATGEGYPKQDIKLLINLGNTMDYVKTGENSWTVKVQEDGKTKELFIVFPPDCIDQVGWDEGDTVIWEELPNGNWSLKKKENNE